VSQACAAVRRFTALAPMLQTIALIADEHEVARSVAFPEPAFAVERARVAPDLKLNGRSRRHCLSFRKTLQLLAGDHVSALAVPATFSFVLQRELHPARNGFERLELHHPLSGELALSYGGCIERNCESGAQARKYCTGNSGPSSRLLCLRELVVR